MPHITVDHSQDLTGVLDRRAFALELHHLTVEVISTSLASCKTHFCAMDEVVLGDGAAGDSFLHVQFAILPGRTAETKAQLTEKALELVLRHVKGSGTTVHASVDVGDLSEAYCKHVGR